ncbi:hypothetical protein ASwh1_201 [Aeromonas phage Aswh_1]|nr:hypothetical protein ASwh1_201 [Aeromonas phage Aswh_1]
MPFGDYVLLVEETEERGEDDKPQVSVEKFLGKIMAVMTKSGLDELERYYKSRRKTVSISDTDDIQIRDAIEGRKEAFAAEEAGEGEEVEDF